MRSNVPRSSAAAVALTLLASTAAWSQSGFDGQRYTPAVGAAGGLMVERPVVPRHLGFGLGLVGNYAEDAVVERDRALGTILSRPLDQALTVNALASIGLFQLFELGADLPLHLIYTGDPVSLGDRTLQASGGVGDLRLVPKLAFSSQGSTRLAFGVALPVTLPTGDPAALRGSGHVTVHPQLLLGARSRRWAASANAGVHLRPGASPADVLTQELTLGLGGQVALIPRREVLDLMLEAVSAFDLADNPRLSNLPIELLGGLGIHPHPDWTIEAGGGAGLTRGLGDPRFRAILGVRFTPSPASDYADSDNDGVSDAADRCPHQVEDQDGFEDEDGCPEADNDRDGVPDDRDECPDEPEGRIGDGDGCPEGEVTLVAGRIVLRGKVQFETGSSALKPKSERILDRVALIMKENPHIKKLRIEGHTDETGPALSNQQLSEHRANTVRQGLIRRGVAPGRLVAVGYGESRPIAPNKSPAGRAKNRRVEFVLP